MDYKELVKNLKAWEEEYISSACGERAIKCERFCLMDKDCLVTQATTAITDLLARAEAAEARVRELETSFRTEKCENGPECAELGRARKRADAAEARCETLEKMVKEYQEELIPGYRDRAEKAEMERDECKAKYCAKEPFTTCIHYEEKDCDGDCLS